MRQIFLIIILVFPVFIFGQHQELHEKTTLWKTKKEHTASDSSTLFSTFHHGTFHGHFRNYFMATDNESNLSDYYAWALGGGIKYETGSLRNFKFGMSGFVVFNVYSSNLVDRDPTTNQMNRYELGLFDIEDPSNRNDIDRLEELYLKYEREKFHITIGRQLINETFINLQDGRMRPTEVQGITMDYLPSSKVKLSLGVLDEISPRSTVRWYRIGESIGVYASGVGADGKASHYHHNIRSEYVAYGTVQANITPRLKIKATEQYIDRLFNTAFLQADLILYKDSMQSLSIAGQTVRQDEMGDQGYFHEEGGTYMEKNAKAWTFGGRLVYRFRRNEWSLNYNRITAHGRYLMPREWGRDPFFTFLPRERNEGFGDVHASMVKYTYTSRNKHLKTSAAAGYYQLPDVLNTALNKYGLPSYYQFLAEMRYEFAGKLKGFDAQLLYTYKLNAGETYNNQKFVINKVNMHLVNLVINYHF